MKFMEKAKRFFTLSAKREGFTLVELIVVIAILAILAGVAVPAYSGYISKSERASDDTLLNAVNKAFASALSANGSDIWLTGDATLAETENSYTIATVNGKADAKVAASFAIFFQGNEGLKFKKITPVFDPYKAMFVAKGEETAKTVTLGKNNYLIALKNIDAFKGSVFADDVGAMQGQLTGISGAFESFFNGSAAEASSISPGLADFMDKNGYGDEDLGNAAVLYVAQNAGSFTAQDVAQMFGDCSAYIRDNNDTSLVGIMGGAFKGSDKDGLTSIALMYGAVTAYANSEVGKQANPELAGQLKNVSNGDDLVSVFTGLDSNTNFQAYVGDWSQGGDGKIIAGESFTNDMNGFLGAMDAINTVAPDVKTDDTGFWADEEVTNLLNSLLKN